MSDSILEKFLTAASDALSESVLILSLHDCSFVSQSPSGVLLPGREGERFDMGLVQQALGNKQTVVMACTSLDEEDEASVRATLRQLSSLGSLCILVAHLISESELRRDCIDEVMLQHEKMIATGVDDVLINPDLDADALRQSVALARSSWQLKGRSAGAQNDPPIVTSIEELRSLSQQHHDLLWDNIPKSLMPQLREESTNLIENDTQISDYQIVRTMPTIFGTVKEVLNNNGDKFALKVIDKLRIVTPGELEGIYREFRFLTRLLQHPNIVKCIDFFHTPACAYLLFEHAGQKNLGQLLVSLPSQRLEPDSAWSCFSQLASAVQYCHSKHVSHRSISLEHVVVSELNASSHHYTLIDFQAAMVAQGDTTSLVVCGRFPCMAPEIASGASYIPRYADLWSTGMVLLETAGGLESSIESLSPEVLEDTLLAFEEIYIFFQSQGSHLKALTSLGATPSAEILNALENLLRPEPETRQLLVGAIVLSQTVASCSGYVSDQRAAGEH